ncbi:DNA-3-methyladenine glycosylase family protein [Halobacterium jilantaiense]|uniref:DNA-(apurinic or apyrimidinic site) lyase n=1 Tax=Halobacterium jilantaiense TaxID=355548 RepID=A0A1I0MIL0_9EURY|nr:DNA-3-methyladenine glycosylase [Halobacterium jilantaiense]SEV88177.1 N-glycosylase/DNA lyase [Halobacterium jilantaiense]
MERGAIPLDSVPGAVDVQATLESGQTYLWWRPDGDTYQTDGLSGGDAWYRTVVGDDVLEVRQSETAVEWRATTDAAPLVRELLGLDDDLHEIRRATHTDDLTSAAWDAYDGLRIVRDPFFGCLVSFICSAQMRVERIFGMQERLRREYGTPIDFDGETVHGFPEPDALAAATEQDLRDLKLGYRAPYVQRTAEMVASGELTEADIRGRAYELAREELTGFVGVGDKVADCVLLFSLGYLEAVPLDTWMQTAIEDHYPDCDQGNYADTSRAFREQLGPYAGYTQTYLFHFLRAGRNEA